MMQNPFGILLEQEEYGLVRIFLFFFVCFVFSFSKIYQPFFYVKLEDDSRIPNGENRTLVYIYVVFSAGRGQRTQESAV